MEANSLYITPQLTIEVDELYEEVKATKEKVKGSHLDFTTWVKNNIFITFAWTSWAGKDTLMNVLHKYIPHSKELLRITTREPREWEIDGVHYHFVSQQYFSSLEEGGDLIWHEKTQEWYSYWFEKFHIHIKRIPHNSKIFIGSSWAQLADILRTNEKNRDIRWLYIIPQNVKEQIDRLRNRWMDEVQIQKRLQDTEMYLKHYLDPTSPLYRLPLLINSNQEDPEELIKRLIIV